MRATLTSLAGASALTLLLACGGGGGGSSAAPTSTHATALDYTNPTTGTYQLVKDPASIGGTLVLDLVTSSSTPLSGVSFSFSADTTKVTWGAAAQNGNTFVLGSGAQAFTTKISGNDLQAVVSQKGTASPVTPTGASVLAKVTLTLNAHVSKGAITFTDSGKGAILTTVVANQAIAVGQLNAK